MDVERLVSSGSILLGKCSEIHLLFQLGSSSIPGVAFARLVQPGSVLLGGYLAIGHFL
jgi:hypothetical protein